MMTNTGTSISTGRASSSSPSSSCKRRRQNSLFGTFRLARTCVAGVVILTAWFSDRASHHDGRRQQPVQQHRHFFFVESLELLGGQYRTASTTSDEIILGLLGLSLDLRDMRRTDSIDEKQDLYMNGRDPKSNASYPMNDPDFWAPLTLSTLSLYLTAEMRDDPIFNMYLYGFDRIGMQRQHPSLRLDGDNVVNHTATTTTTVHDPVDDIIFLLIGEPSQTAASTSSLEDDRDEYSDLDWKKDEMGYFGGYPVEEYAHTLVMNSLSRISATTSEEDGPTGTTNNSSNGMQKILPVEDIILATMVWMAVAHELHEVVRLCGDEYNATQSVAALDRAVALWLGTAVSNTSNNEGMTTLYHLTQSAGSSFRRHDDSGETPKTEPWVNQELLQRWKSIQLMLLTSSENCFLDDPFILHLREEIYRSINQMTIPLIQNLIFSMLDDSKKSSSLSTVNSFDVYYSVVVPQIMTCDPDLAQELFFPLSIGTMNDKEKEQWVHTLERTYSCFRISCRDVGIFRDDVQRCDDDTTSRSNSSFVTFAGYVATDPDASRAVSVIDRDILQLSIFLKYGSLASAKEWYSFGYNSVHSLRTLANGDAFPPSGATTNVSQFGLYQTYYDNPTFADVEINTALNFDGEFQLASHETIEAVVLGLIRFEVMYLSVATALQYAVEQCEIQEPTLAEEYWDIGVALLVGSIERSNVGDGVGGQLLYGLSRELCSHFGTCNTNSSNIGGINSISNEKLISALSRAKLKLSTDECRDVNLMLEDTILPSLRIPLIQGTILYSSRLYRLDANDSSTDSRHVDADIGFAHATSRSILPLVADADKQSADAIDQLLRFRANETYDTDNAIVTIMDSFRSALPAMGVYCKDVGMLTTVREELCPDIGASGTSTTSNYSNIALDVVEMKQSLEEGNRAVAENIYIHGKNSFGVITGNLSSLISLRSLSVNATLEMLDEPLFIKFLYSNTSRMGGTEARAFADAYVSRTFRNMSPSSKTLPAEAAVVLNVWMYVAHQVAQPLTACSSSYFDVDETAKSLEIASAYWVGDADVGNPRKTGNLLYGLADDVGNHFSRSGDSSPHVNESFLTLLDTAKKVITEIGPTCPISGYVKLRETVNAIVHQMTIPLVQGLIHYLLTNDPERVSLYATSVIPMLVVCQQDDYQFLSAKLLEDKVKAIETEEILVRLYRSLHCLGIRCDDIGKHYAEDNRQGSDFSLCHVATNAEAKHAGFHAGDSFHQYSRLDLDLREMDILMQMGSFEIAENIYKFGKHTNTSLAQLANSPSRNHTPHFMAYSRFFNSDIYADTLVVNALTGVGDPRSLTDLQRRVLSLRFSQTLVLGHGALDIIFASIADCYDGQNSSQLEGKSGRATGMNLNAWDEAAGLLIGSIWRNSTDLAQDDNNNWYTPFDLAQRECMRFGTCVTGQIGFVNRKMIELLYAGRSASTMESCPGLRKIGDDLRSLLLVPIIQATLSAAQAVSQSTRTPQDTAELFVFSETILPLITDISNETATSLRSLFAAAATTTDSSLLYRTFVELSPLYDELNVDCDLVGSFEGLDACDVSGIYSSNSSESLSSWAVVGIAVSCAIFVIGTTVLVIAWKRKKSRKKRGKLLALSPSPDETEAQDHDDVSSVSHYSYNDVDEYSTNKCSDDELEDTAPATSDARILSHTLSSDSDYTPSSAQSSLTMDHILNSFPRESPTMSRTAKKTTSRIDRYGDDVPFADEVFGFP